MPMGRELKKHFFLRSDATTVLRSTLTAVAHEQHLMYVLLIFSDATAGELLNLPSCLGCDIRLVHSSSSPGNYILYYI